MVGSCSGSWPALVATLTPVRHWDFAASADPAADLPAPGLLLCDATGARALHGGLEEHVADPAGAIPDASVGGVALWVALSDTTTTGDLIWFTQADGYGVGLRVSAGLLELVEVPSGGGDATVLAQTPAPGPGTAPAHRRQVGQHGGALRGHRCEPRPRPSHRPAAAT